MKIFGFFIWVVIYSFFYELLIEKSNDIDFYMLGLDLYVDSLESNFDFSLFYLTDSLFYHGIYLLSKVLFIKGENILLYFGLILSICKLLIFKFKYKQDSNLFILLYLLNFFYLFEINQLRESLVVTIYLFLSLFNFRYIPLIGLTFFHKSAFLLLLTKHVINFKIFLIILFTIYISFGFIQTFLSNKWTSGNEELNVLTINTFIYVIYFSSIYIFKCFDLNKEYLLLIVIAFLSFFLLKSISSIIAIRIYELGLFFIMLSFPRRIILNKNNIWFFISWVIFSIYNIVFISNKYFVFN